MYQFLVKGKTGSYTVSIDKKKNNLIATCNCSAASYGMACWHLFKILSGDSEGVISDNKNEVTEIPEFINDTVDGQLFLEYLIKKEKLDQLEKEVPALKKQLSKILPI
jgi:hypothetical protein